MTPLDEILQAIIKSFFDNEWPEYFQDDVDNIFKKWGITKYTNIVRRKGTWSKPHKGLRRCSVCKIEMEVREYRGKPLFNYCPYCGARMDGGEND